MTSRVLAIAIDGPNVNRFHQWLEAGHLPAIRSIMSNGAQCLHFHTKRFRNERCWDLFLRGADLGTSGSTFVPTSYEYYNNPNNREHRYIPFYALNGRHRTCVFDLPATLSKEVNGIQVLGWGSELNVSRAESLPASVIDEIQASHGRDPKLTQSMKVLDYETQEVEYSYVIPNLYDYDDLQLFKQRLLTSIERRTAIALDLISRDDWDLYLLNFPEIHSANHQLWHLGEPHPIGQPGSQSHALLEVFQAVDQAIGQIKSVWPKDETVAVFTLDNTADNCMDVPTMAILPEILYRWNYPGRALLSPGPAGAPLPPLRRNYSRLWKHEVWALVTDSGKAHLDSPAALEASGSPFSWHPAIWYRKCWPNMKAFALPSMSDGYVRVNIREREAQGTVDPSDYAQTLASIESVLQTLTNPRTGDPAIKSITRTRQSPSDHPDIAPDLIVSWNDVSPADCLECAELGRVGPLPYFRTGGHLSHGSSIEGLFAAQGPGIVPGTIAQPGNLLDVPVTILDLMGLPPQPEMTGRSLFV